MEVAVVIVGAGQSGLAVAACLNTLNISNLVLDRDDCIASLWRKRSYDRVHLHLAKNYCQLPYFPHPSTTPNFIPKAQFISYLDDYAARFNACIKLRRNVESADFDDEAMLWRIVVKNLSTGETEEYTARFLVVASGENDMIVLPELEGMESFGGELVHSSQYRTGEKYEGKAVLVVGSGNSGMEIAYDLACCGARTSIVVRSPLHMVTKEIWMLGMLLMKYLPCILVDAFVLFLCYLFFGDTSKYGLQRPDKGPFYLKINTPAYPVIDVGTFKKIKSGEIQETRHTNVIEDIEYQANYFDGISFHIKHTR
uniref:indole-3-pyruvate monooxygenase n=1 Tax=Lilium sp. c114455 TaxID=2749903 RepID=A0A9Y0VEN2_9LILI|nr:YUCCA10 [Lilium sp. c114455]